MTDREKVLEEELHDHCKACGKPLLLRNLYVDDGCPCNAPRGVNLEPRRCEFCRTDNCVKPGHRHKELFGFAAPSEAQPALCDTCLEPVGKDGACPHQAEHDEYTEVQPAHGHDCYKEGCDGAPEQLAEVQPAPDDVPTYPEDPCDAHSMFDQCEHCVTDVLVEKQTYGRRHDDIQAVPSLGPIVAVRLVAILLIAVFFIGTYLGSHGYIR